jgi:adenosine deaminase
VRRAEIFFDPQQHLSHGVPLPVVFAGLSSALAEAADWISADLILCFLRDRGPEEAMATLRAARPVESRTSDRGGTGTRIGAALAGHWAY